MQKINERFVFIFLLLVCAMWIGYSGRIPNVTLPGAPGPNFFPFIIVALLAFLTILHEVLFFSRWLREKKKEPAGTAKTVPSGGSAKPNQKKVIVSFTLLFLFVLGIDYIGFYTSTLITIFLIFKGIFALQSWLKSLFITVVITGSIFVVFTLLFRLSLPRGILL